MADEVICSFCSREAVVTLAYANNRMCKKHFCEYIEKRFKRTVREFSMLKKGDYVGIGLSGGKDSTVLMHLLHSLSKSLPIKLVAITIDEGISGYRTPSLNIAIEQAKKLGIMHKIYSFKKVYGHSMDAVMKGKPEEAACSYCGVFRRHLLNKACKELGVKKLAIGHNLDDVAQTVLMNIMRNEPQRLLRFGGVSGVIEDEGFVPRIKPLMRIPEREIGLYAILKDIPIKFQECPYAYTAMRQLVRVQLNEMEEKYPGTKFRILNSFLAIKENVKPTATRATLRYCKKCGEPTSTDICVCCRLVEKLDTKN
ncbi:tRNA 2-thiocytidine biosynthesis protein TtcA [Candidatus Anstonella stagnisolia]|nr:tRNA 2-thiocytidine biosynthesis protein TtcA [Candidatus Anstonella stagnisolia]